jgi:hypothetical protein
MQERRSTLNKSTVDEKAKEKWKRIMESEFMSSEESADDEDGEDIIIVKPLCWRADKVTRFFHQLDAKSVANKTPQARRQRKSRVISSYSSDRPQPESDKFPAWSIVN